MTPQKITTIDIQAKEWFDRVNGNSYFSAVITIDFGLNTERVYKLPFQYGYENHYIQAASEFLSKHNELHTSDNYVVLWRYCDENNIVLNTSIKRNCNRRELNS